MKRVVIAILIALAAVAGGAAILFSPSTGKEAKPKDEPRIVAIKRGAFQTRVAETGTLEPVRTIEIKSQVSGEVRRVDVVEGQVVSRGQALAVIQQEPSQARQVAQLRATLEEERVNVEQTELALKRMETLLEQGFVSRRELELAQQDLKRARVRQALAERQLLLALGGNHDLYEQYLKQKLTTDKLVEFVIQSPSAGTVLEKKVHPGEIITSGTATFGGGSVLMSIADLNRMVVKAKINEVNIGRL